MHIFIFNNIMAVNRRVKLEHKQICLLDNEQRSASFDEEALSLNQQRKIMSAQVKLEAKLTPSRSTKASRSKSLNALNEGSLQRQRLQHILRLDPLDDTVISINKLLSKSRKIIVLTGAGISCNAGIPDFRSSNGLYNLVKKEHPNVTIGSGKEMFDISLFRDEMKISVWATFMEKLYSSCRLAKPTKTHKFIAHLKDRSKLLRCYTQNIDGLEESLGLELSSQQPEEEEFLEKQLSHNNSFTSFSNSKWKNFDVVQLHGDLNKLSCTRCFHVFQWNRFRARSFRRGELPICPNCEAIKLKRSEQGKRVIDHNGMLRPNIVLYGENHPSGDVISQGLNLDILKGRPDFFIIMGTSLKVDGVKKVVKQISKQVHERDGIVILVNKSSVGESTWNGCIDYQIWEDCDKWVGFLENQVPDFFKTQKEVDKVRQLKREASELRKKLHVEKKKQSELQSLKTPPTTPTRENSSELNEDSDLSLEKKCSDNGNKSLNELKRKLIAPTNNIINYEIKDITLSQVVVNESESDDDVIMSGKIESIFKKEVHIATTSP